MKPQLAGRVSSSVRNPNWSQMGVSWTFMTLWAAPGKNIDFERGNCSA